MSITLPGRQPIGGNPYTVTEVDEMWGGGCAGCDKEGKRLVIEKAPTDWERTVRYAHECIHGGEVEYGMGPFLDDANNSDVDRLAHLFAEMHYNLVLWGAGDEE